MQLRVADAIVQECVLSGVTHAFMVTGGGAMHLNDAIFKNAAIEKYFFHHEQAAAIAAEGFARVKNEPVLLNVTTGPGGVNALNGVYGAFVDSIPMIVISGQVKRATMMGAAGCSVRQLGDQEVDIISMVKKITKYSCVLSEPRLTRQVIKNAILIAKSGRPGPVWIDIPIDVQASGVSDETLIDGAITADDLINSNDDLHKSVANEFITNSSLEVENCIRIFIERLNNSKRPLLLVGNGVHAAQAETMLGKFINALKIPVVTAWNAHDLVGDDCPYYVGRPGTVGDRSGNFAVQDADLLLVIGSRLNIRQISYNWDAFAKNAWKTMVDVDLGELCKSTLNIDNKIHADINFFFQKFFKNITLLKRNCNHYKYLETCKRRQREYPVLSNAMVTKDVINPYHFIYLLFEALHENSTIVCGNGSACVMTFQVAKIKLGQRLFTNSGAASMGYDLPAAIGACIALQNKKDVICIAGDGSLMMNLQELQTVVHHRLNIKIIIINNNGYSSIKQTQKNYFPDRINGVDKDTGLSFPDFIKVARAFGFDSMRISEPNEIKIGLEWLTMGHEPKLLEVIVDENQDFEPKLKSRVNSDGSMSSPELDDMYPFLSENELLRNRRNGNC